LQAQPVPVHPAQSGLLTFLADENIQRSTRDFLQGKGFAVLTMYDLQAHGATDEVVARKAANGNYVVVTHDKGFADFERFNIARHPGVLILPSNNLVAPLRCALHHFVVRLTPVIAQGWGDHRVIHYTRQGEILVYKPSPENPGKPITVTKGRYNVLPVTASIPSPQ
jgi:predicted nuclease of predicted toxin-antitoxin system